MKPVDVVVRGTGEQPACTTCTERGENGRTRRLVHVHESDVPCASRRTLRHLERLRQSHAKTGNALCRMPQVRGKDEDVPSLLLAGVRVPVRTGRPRSYRKRGYSRMPWCSQVPALGSVEKDVERTPMEVHGRTRARPTDKELRRLSLYDRLPQGQEGPQFA